MDEPKKTATNKEWARCTAEGCTRNHFDNLSGRRLCFAHRPRPRNTKYAPLPTRPSSGPA